MYEIVAAKLNLLNILHFFQNTTFCTSIITWINICQNWDKDVFPLINVKVPHFCTELFANRNDLSLGFNKLLVYLSYALDQMSLDKATCGLSSLKLIAKISRCTFMHCFWGEGYM